MSGLLSKALIFGQITTIATKALIFGQITTVVTGPGQGFWYKKVLKIRALVPLRRSCVRALVLGQIAATATSLS